MNRLRTKGLRLAGRGAAGPSRPLLHAGRIEREIALAGRRKNRLSGPLVKLVKEAAR